MAADGGYFVFLPSSDWLRAMIFLFIEFSANWQNITVKAGQAYPQDSINELII